MTPQAFSYGTVATNGMIYMPPYGLNQSIDYMLKLNPNTYEITRIPLNVTNTFEKWVFAISHNNKIFVLPFSEQSVLVIDTTTDTTETIDLGITNTGKYVYGHLYKDKIFALPYGDHNEFDDVLVFDTTNNTFEFVKLNMPINNHKKWHTTQLVGNTIHGMPRGDCWSPDFPYRIEFNCDTLEYKLEDISYLWKDLTVEEDDSAKFTTMAKYKDKLFVPPYCRDKHFDVMGIYENGSWTYSNTGQQATSRKYFTHIVSKSGKIYFAPAGHDEDWCELMIVDGNTNNITIKELGIGKESKKYFAGCENSQGKIYYIPRGGCVCMPEETWKEFGDLTEILVINTADDSTYTIDVSEYYDDCTTIEKYNNCVIVNDKIFALPYGESDSFQDILVFDTITETVIKKINLNEV